MVLLSLGAIIPPARIPKALKYALRIILCMTGDEVDVAAEGFVEECEARPLDMLDRECIDSVVVIQHKIEGHAVGDFGFQEEEIFRAWR